MAYEKECDYTLKKLNETLQIHTISSMYHSLKFDGFEISANDIIAILSILKQNEHVFIHRDQSGFLGAMVDKENGETTFHGYVQISQAGCAFIVGNSYYENKRRGDMLMDLTISNGNIQKSLLYINRWIAFGGVAVAAASILEIVRNYYNPILPFLVYVVFPFLIAAFLVWLGIILIPVIRNKMNKHK